MGRDVGRDVVEYLVEIAQSTSDVFIVGGGPVGLATAICAFREAYNSEQLPSALGVDIR